MVARLAQMGLIEKGLEQTLYANSIVHYDKYKIKRHLQGIPHAAALAAWATPSANPLKEKQKQITSQSMNTIWTVVSKSKTESVTTAGYLRHMSH